ncbi:P-loop containing nucleoside triphosphate hydrolase protein [Dipodascopsis tothii]|uniref:P-loop containing nucleoside triphosphate hydrolase protein n=1 Tax=Dipodascopsis tothii TaxID=44089 RepID=UPI0034CEE2F7
MPATSPGTPPADASRSLPGAASPAPADGVPRLMSSQISHQFNVLKLDLKLGAVSPVELVSSLEKSAVASLLDGKIAQILKHLVSLRERIEDTSSKVLVTGDLNAGKSSLCNALLRRNVLPEDQQPCTNVFCEVLDAQINSGVEEVHAVPHGAKYDRRDESTYDVYALSELERLALEPEIYVILKVYVDDKRPPEQSLLRNGVVDIALIDAPGLNMDSMQTTAVFARQEEIDVVVFVVSAENHFTLSAKEFIWNAAHEKTFIFIVVNRFDNIKDKKRCARLILDQVSSLSPKTFEHANELVHFVAANKVERAPDGDDSDGDDDGDGDAGDAGKPADKPGKPGKGKADDEPSPFDQMQTVNRDQVDFDRLETALRNFVLEKRAMSKLAPAKTYLVNVLSDLEAIAAYNEDITTSEVQRLHDQLEEIVPTYERTLQDSVRVGDEINTGVDDIVSHVFEHVRGHLQSTILEIGHQKYVEYPGIFAVYNYARDTRDAMLQRIQSSVLECEEYARQQTAAGFDMLKAIGLRHLRGSDHYVEKFFNQNLMFTRKRDLLARASISTAVEITDYVDFDRNEKAAGMSLSLTLATVAGGQVLGFPTTLLNGFVKVASIFGIRNLHRLVVPALTVAGICGVVYLISDVPNVVPRKLARKLKDELEAVDYVHTNSDRISKECRKVLRFPMEDIRVGFQKVLDEVATQKTERTSQMEQAETASKYFAGLKKEARGNRSVIARMNLDDFNAQAD